MHVFNRSVAPLSRARPLALGAQVSAYEVTAQGPEITLPHIQVTPSIARLATAALPAPLRGDVTWSA